MCTTATHLLEDTLGIKFGFQTLESTVNGLSIFDINATNMFLHKENPQGPTGSGKLGATDWDVKPAFIEKKSLRFVNKMGRLQRLKFFFFAIVFRNGREEVFTLQEEGDGDVLEEVVPGAVNDTGERDHAVDLGDGAMDHGGDDVVIVDFFLKEVGDAEDEEGPVEVVFAASEGELFVGAHEEFEGQREALLVELHGRFSNDGKGVEIGEGLGVEMNVGVMRLERGGENLATLDGFAVPALSPEGIDDGMELPGNCHGREDGMGHYRKEEFLSLDGADSFDRVLKI